MDPKKPISMDVTYGMPVMVRTHVGGTPLDYFSESGSVTNPTVPNVNNSCGSLPHEVYVDLPQMKADGAPELKMVRKHLEDRPADPVSTCVAVGGIAAAVLGTAGIIVGSIVGSPILGVAVGAAVGALAGGTGGAVWARGDRIRMEYDVIPIRTARYTAYRETAQPTTVQGRQGYNHHFTPMFEVTPLGEYKIPKIVHYRAE